MKHARFSLTRDHLPEYTTEAVIIVISTGLLIFIKLTEVVINGSTSGFDQRALLWFRNPADLADPIGPPWLEVVVRDITALGGVAVLGMLCIASCGYLWLRQKKQLAAYVAIAVISGTLVNTLLKNLIMRPRPDLVPHGTPAALSSFPSGHAMMSAMVFLTLGALLSLACDDARTKGYILFWSVFLTVLVGISRLYLGVHWPTDILGGWIAGGTWALLCLLASRWIFNRPGILSPNEAGDR